MRIHWINNSVIFLMLLSVIPKAETNLTGKIGGKTLGPEGNPYIINENIVVEPNAQTVIQAGCIFLFNSFSGMVVEGGLRVEGTLEKPVVFTTKNDRTYSNFAENDANPFDWNGIYVTKNASKVIMSNFLVAYSVYGVKSEKEEFCVQNGSFKANGQFHLTVKNVIEPVIENYPFSYGKSSEERVFVPKQNQSGSTHIVVPFAFGTIGVTSGVISGIFLAKGFGTHEEFASEKDPDISKQLENQGRSEFFIAGATGAAFIVCVPVAVYLLIKKNKRGQAENRVSFYPVVTSGLSCAGFVLKSHF